LAFHSGRKADNSPTSNAEVKEWVELYLHSPNTPSWRGAQLGGAQGTSREQNIINVSEKPVNILTRYTEKYSNEQENG
jgi:hypothetical protein